TSGIGSMQAWGAVITSIFLVSLTWQPLPSVALAEMVNVPSAAYVHCVAHRLTAGLPLPQSMVHAAPPGTDTSTGWPAQALSGAAIGSGPSSTTSTAAETLRQSGWPTHDTRQP